MSKSTILGGIGAGIGFFFGGPAGAQAGWAIGSFLGAAITEGPNSLGPRLNDLQAETIEYGSDIPIVYGRARIAGFRMWQRDIREQANEEDAGGKGGGGATVTTFTYYGTWAVNLCEGPIVGVRKIWADSNLIYNLGDTSDLETIIASNRAANGIRFYTGTADQEPDSLIQATQGAANTPAYRNTAYIVFDDFALEKYGNRIPNITAEVVGAGSNALRLVDNQEIADGSANFNHQATYWDKSNGYLIAFVGDWTSTYSTSGITVYKQYVNGVIEKQYKQSIGGSGSSYNSCSTFSQDNAYCAFGSGSIFTPQRFRVYQAGVSSLIRANFESQGLSVFSNSSTECCVDGDDVYLLKTSSANPRTLERFGLSAGRSAASSSPATWAGGALLADSNGDLSTFCHALTVLDDVVYVLNSNNTITKFSREGGLIETLNVSFSPTMTYESSGPADPQIRAIDERLWVIADNRLFSMGLDGSDIVYYGSPSSITGVNPTNNGGRNYYYGVYHQYAVDVDVESANKYRTFQLESLSLSGVTLNQIQSDVCIRSGLSASDFDVTELTDTVEGYVISKNMSGRAATEPLQKAFLYDGAEIDGKIKFIKRGNSSIANISQDDLGAGDDVSENAQLTTTRQQDSELPSDVTIGYISNIRDYEVGTQASRRINFNTLNSLTQELPIVMSDDYAAKIADITHYNAWTEREKYNFSLTNEYIDLNPTDVVTVNYNDEARIVRLTKISYGDVLECEAVSEDAQIYTSDATAAEDGYVDQVVGLAGPTRVEYMDIPLLRNQDNDAGLYYAATGYFASWTGAQIFKSLDEGITYNSVASVFTASTIGVTTNSLGTADPELWDRTNTLTINLANGSFSSTTEDGALRGTNTLLVGSEVINFVNATLNADGTYTLDTFIRGRRGTEWAVNSHAVGDRVVLLRESDIRRFEAILNTERTYKAVTINTFIDEAEEELVTNNGINLKPFSPVLISGTRDGSNNLTGTFTRRSRYITSPLWTPPLFEESQEYEIDIMDGATVLRTISVTTTSFSYTAAQQTTDFGSPQSEIEVNIFQISSVIGRGYGGNATI